MTEENHEAPQLEHISDDEAMGPTVIINAETGKPFTEIGGAPVTSENPQAPGLEAANAATQLGEGTEAHTKALKDIAAKYPPKSSTE